MGILSKLTTHDLDEAIQAEIDQLSYTQKEEVLAILRSMNAHRETPVEITMEVPPNPIAEAAAARVLHKDEEITPEQQVPGGTAWDVVKE